MNFLPAVSCNFMNIYFFDNSIITNGGGRCFFIWLKGYTIKS